MIRLWEAVQISRELGYSLGEARRLTGHEWLDARRALALIGAERAMRRG